MASDSLAWLANELGLPTVHETAAGLIANAAASEALGPALPESLEGVVARLLGIGAEDPDVQAACKRARSGRPTTLPSPSTSAPPGPWRVLIDALEGGRARAIALPPAKQQTVRMQRRATAADAAAAVAHEVSNALSAIVGWAQLGREAAGERAKDDALVFIETSAQDARQSARQLLELARGSATVKTEPIDVDDLLGEIVRLLSPEARRRQVTLEHVPGGAPLAKAARAPLLTIVWNLALNAVEAVKPGGRVTLGSGRTGQDVGILVADDGPGMDEAEQKRIFEPYFTTKPGGTGLGLAIVRDAVEQLGGKIKLDSELGRGTRFVVTLPPAGAAAAAAPSTPPPSPQRPPSTIPRRVGRAEQRRSGVVGKPRLEGARVLVVEDDATVRELLVTTLELRGAKVLTASGAEEALRQAGPFDVALIDLSLSDARGDMLLAELRKRNIVSVAALASGGAAPDDLAEGGEPDAWLRKPFDLPDLMAVMRHLLRPADDAKSQGGGE